MWTWTESGAKDMHLRKSRKSKENKTSHRNSRRLRRQEPLRREHKGKRKEGDGLFRGAFIVGDKRTHRGHRAAGGGAEGA